MNEILIEKMTQTAQNVQAIVKHVDNEDEILQYVIDVTKDKGGKSITSAGLVKGLAGRLKESAEAQSVEYILPPLSGRLNDIHTSLTPAHFGIAETGTIVVKSRREDMRIATMLPDVHIAVLNTADIHPDSFALLEDLDAEFKASPGYLAFITGASRTADIERVLTIGVHGPKELHILLTDKAFADETFTKEAPS